MGVCDPNGSKIRPVNTKIMAAQTCPNLAKDLLTVIYASTISIVE